jgi:hypothetical protein
MATFLADKSALTRGDTRPQVRNVIEPLLVAGEIATCGSRADRSTALSRCPTCWSPRALSARG